MLARINIMELKKELEDIVKTSKSKQKRTDALNRLKVTYSFVPDPTKKRLNKPEWMIVSILPVIPPELRPLVPLEGGRFAASDLNDLYRRIIIRNSFSSIIMTFFMDITVINQISCVSSYTKSFD